ncbi:hypothetical protein BSZ21_02790 [Bradyrhizobium canariense]|nr:hypothetical protein BST65_13840 [Bradyrhizobium canariense]OSI34664.1 hypothetical protein BST66_10150 [Bradyrhizobium canariense]OSI46097.1 hypothetical protein BSZ20_11610 [Bradyrhizobium canariense]OSI53296.1 hypothetical protein BST67_09325 [Bradyrhizobium canariense]OSI57033.1 hypothetical protein BSZ15_15305 [Bradyrhizobium canariense]
MFSLARLITSNQAAISALFRVVNRHVGNFAPMPGCFRTIRIGAFRRVQSARSSRLRVGMPPSTGGPPLRLKRNSMSRPRFWLFPLNL